MADKKLKCKECGADFIFSERDQAFYKEKGYENEPQRCPACRAARKQQRGYGASQDRPEREMYSAVCAQCGKETTVPFKPNNEKPVYCRECYQSRNSR
jgi:CxxC-x17-CxxC domain-containing protein